MLVSQNYEARNSEFSVRSTLSVYLALPYEKNEEVKM